MSWLAAKNLINHLHPTQKFPSPNISLITYTDTNGKTYDIGDQDSFSIMMNDRSGHEDDQLNLGLYAAKRESLFVRHADVQ